MAIFRKEKLLGHFNQEDAVPSQEDAVPSQEDAVPSQEDAVVLMADFKTLMRYADQSRRHETDPLKNS
jgi:hypothetical protein